jgi:hypothetical protein
MVHSVPGEYFQPGEGEVLPLTAEEQARLDAMANGQPVPVSLADLMAAADAWEAERRAAAVDPSYVPPPLAPEHERYRLYSVEDLGRFPPVEWWIPGYLPVGELIAFYGKGDTFKTFLALDWSCWLAGQGHPVLYVVAEGFTGAKARVLAWMKSHGVEELPALALMPSNVDLHSQESVATAVEAWRSQMSESPVLVVIDTLARNFVGGNESSPQEMGRFVEGCETVRRAFGATVLVIHHTTVDGKRERGTEALRNATFAMYKFERVNHLPHVDVECDRMKDAPQPHTVRLVPGSVDLSEEIGPGISSLVAGWPYDAAPTPERPVAPLANVDGQIVPGLGPRDQAVEDAVVAYLREHGASSQRALEEGVAAGRDKVRAAARRLATRPEETGVRVEAGTNRSLVYSLSAPG